jgi:hypothetical protein
MNQRLLDVRNYRNFRSTNNEDGTNGTIKGKTVSTSYLCSAKDFLYSETMNLTSDVVSGIFKPRIQTLIINEYQPYVADYGLVKLAGAGVDTAKKLLGGVGDMIAEGVTQVASARTDRYLEIYY